MKTTIRDNIIFGEPYRPRRYERVLLACALKQDIDLMPDGDLTEIGANGINLSGGQKQRIAIARAVYSSANVVIMVIAVLISVHFSTTGPHPPRPLAGGTDHDNSAGAFVCTTRIT